MRARVCVERQAAAAAGDAGTATAADDASDVRHAGSTCSRRRRSARPGIDRLTLRRATPRARRRIPAEARRWLAVLAEVSAADRGDARLRADRIGVGLAVCAE